MHKEENHQRFQESLLGSQCELMPFEPHTIIDRILLDLEASVNILPYSVHEKLGIRELKPTKIILQLADRSVKIPKGVMEDVLIKVKNFIYPMDFVIL